MLNLNPETVCAIIQRSRAFHAQEQVVIPETQSDSSEPGDESARQALAGYGDDLIFQELKAVISDLEPGQQASLVALMWLGRGDFSVEEWAAGLEQARGRWTPRTAEYLMATPLVSDYLYEGLTALGYNCD